MMNDNPDRPKEYDAVLGGYAPPPLDGAVLGGLEGVKNRLKSTVARERAAALIEALPYREEGLDLLIEALKDSSEQVELFASRLLRQTGSQKGKQALLEHNPWLLFSRLEDWQAENFEPAVGITDPVGTAYNVNLYLLEPTGYGYSKIVEDFTLEPFQVLVKDPQARDVEALACWMSEEYICYEQCRSFVDALCKARKRLTSLKALFIGDRREHEFNKPRLYLSEIAPILKSYPHLEVLKLHGFLSPEPQFKGLRHDYLKTLIIESAWLTSKDVAHICALDLPALEYFELWMSHKATPESIIDSLTPVLSGKSFPNLIYLGLRSFEHADEIVEALVQSPLLDRLAVLDLSMGTLTDKGAEILLQCPAIDRLHTLNVSMNCLSTNMIQKLSGLNCWVISQPQTNEDDRYYALYE